MPKGEVPSRSEQEADECLHCAIIDMVDERIAAGGANAADLTTLIVESLVDIILRVPEEEQAQLMAHTLAALGDEWRGRWRLRIDALGEFCLRPSGPIRAGSFASACKLLARAAPSDDAMNAR